MVRTKKIVETNNDIVIDNQESDVIVGDKYKNLRLITPKQYIDLGHMLVSEGYSYNGNLTFPASLNQVPQSLDMLLIKIVGMDMLDILRLIIEDLSRGNKSRVSAMICNGMRLAGG